MDCPGSAVSENFKGLSRFATHYLNMCWWLKDYISQHTLVQISRLWPLKANHEPRTSVFDITGHNWGFPGGSDAKESDLLTMQETWVWYLGWEDPLEKAMATHANILAWKISWTEEPGGLQSMGSQRVGHDWATEHTHTDWAQRPLFLFITFLAVIRTSPQCSWSHRSGCMVMLWGFALLLS